MEVVNSQILTARFLTAALQLAVASSTVYVAREHVLDALPGACAAEARAMPLLCRQGACEVPLFRLDEVCRQHYLEAQWYFLNELRASMALLAIELISMLSGMGSAHNETRNFFSVIGHAGGFCGSLMFLLKGASCYYYHVLFAGGIVFPFLCELMSWVALLRGSRPGKRFAPPDSAVHRMD
mmetsp:Transcript_11372/g.40348  ORF Transcript_11372/g.40348 Transcript_11372/m.40348 type:complete len:182 (+) Transcript_11372:119-664(+)